ncbi:hypothetical protein HDU98_006491 [Podochytrium sp. JEL0797]|nr:hypothetical protein HDU98_006491 [Podochytrium sp. JEL0797]
MDDPNILAALDQHVDEDFLDDDDESGTALQEPEPSDTHVSDSVLQQSLLLLGRARRAIVEHATDRDTLIQTREYLRQMLAYITANSHRLGELFLASLIPEMDRHIESLDICISNVSDEIKKAYSGRIDVALQRTGGRGRPRKVVNTQKVLELRRLGVTWTLIASLARMHRGSIALQMKAERVVDPYNWTDISDQELLMQVREIISRFPKSGAGFVKSHLEEEYKTRVSRKRVRHAVGVADPIGVFNRLVRTVVRRKYSVAGPHSLQHIDGNHKLN